MPNNYFRFKKFIVYQDRCAMKVCTDACLFGAWTANIADTACRHILDIGTGTGLLSLMVAQKTNAVIDAVEINEAAYEQATENFRSSPWKERLTAIHSPVQLFSGKNKYDLILSNPPFYENDLVSPDHTKNVALHSASLTLHELLNKVSALLSQDGRFAVLLPARRETEFESAVAKSKFGILNKVVVKQTPKHQVFRIMYLLNKEVSSHHDAGEIIIKNSGNIYTDEFYELLKDYYLFETKTDINEFAGKADN